MAYLLRLSTLLSLLLTAVSTSFTSVNAQGTNMLHEWENPQVFEVNRLPQRAHFWAYSRDPGQFELLPLLGRDIQSLNGQWDFVLVDNPFVDSGKFQQPDYQATQWGKIAVPGNWELNGYGYPNYVNMRVDFAQQAKVGQIPHDYNPTGRYRKSFDLPQDWQGKQIIAYFGGVKSAFKLWVNGQYVGYSQDSKSAAEFDITAMLKPGHNLLALEVYRWSDGSYLELQDMWRLSGIERDVFVYARPVTHLQDFHAEATLDDNYRHGVLNFTASVASPATKAQADLALRLTLFNQDKSSRWSQTLALKPQAGQAQSLQAELSQTIKDILPWSAETPNLYPLKIELLDADGSTLQYVWQRLGFRTSELKNGNVLVNGQAILFKGVNRHEHDPISGHVVSEASMRQDMSLMKSLNINAIRNSHYPNNPLWYSLADEYGFYLVDEANIESHGVGASNQGHFYDPAKHMVNMPEWQPAYIDRVKNMYEASKNHPSVVILSIGNESGDGPNIEVLYHWLKQRSNMPVMSEQAQLRPHTDMYAQMYAPIARLEHFADLNDGRPMILCEYEHAMGNSVGNLADYWQLIRAKKALQGGFIWDWVDQTINALNAKGETYAGYGGDFEPEGVYHDGNFSANGLLTADRQLHPHAYEVQQVYQDIHVSAINAQQGQFLLYNERFFADLSQVSLRWNVAANGQVIQQGEVAGLDVAPQAQVPLNLPLAFTPEAGKHYVINLHFVQTTAAAGHVAGAEIAKQQFALPMIAKVSQPVSGPAAVAQASDTLLTVTSPAASYQFDRQTGWLSAIQLGKSNILQAPMLPAFWRAPTDNDFGENFPTKAQVWHKAEHDTRLLSFNFASNAAGQVVVTTEHYLNKVESRYISRYTISGNGELKVDIQFNAAPHHFYSELPRLGHRLILKAGFEDVSWYGRGPHESYADRKASAMFGLYQNTVSGLGHDYVRPQENGHRSDVFWVSFSNQQQQSISFQGEPLIEFNAEHRDLYDYSSMLKEQKHPHDIALRDEVFVNIDFRQRGIAGTDSWGSAPLTRYTLPWLDYHYSFSILPTAITP